MSFSFLCQDAKCLCAGFSLNSMTPIGWGRASLSHQFWFTSCVFCLSCVRRVNGFMGHTLGSKNMF